MHKQELAAKIESTHLMDQRWAETKSLLKNVESPWVIFEAISEKITNSNMSNSDKQSAIYFLKSFFMKIIFEINCEIDGSQEDIT